MARKRMAWMAAAAVALSGAAPGAWAQTEADELLRSAESRFSAALGWLKRQRDAANAEVAARMAAARTQLDEAQRSTDDTPAPAVLRLVQPGGEAGEVTWKVWSSETQDPGPDRLVILVHGLDEPGGIWDELTPAIVSAGHPVARFDYSNDQRIAASADQLAAVLRDLRRAGVDRVELVCHSMGGLVARDVLTRKAHYNGDGTGGACFPRVESLILIGTPNHGSAFASLQRISEMREQFVRWIDSGGTDTDAATRYLRDGRGEAAADLEIGSAFLAELNARPHPEGVRTSVIAGRLGDQSLAAAVKLLDSAIARELIDEGSLAALKASATAWQHEVGDGVVSVTSAQLPGVEDVVVLNANHRTLLRRVTVPGVGFELDSGTPPAIEEVVKRLGK